jgi:hypothetical protein
MALSLRSILSLVVLMLGAYVVWVWVSWFRLGEKVIPKWRARIAVAGFCFASFSTVLSAFLFVDGSFAGGYSVESFGIVFGLPTAMLGLVASIVGKGRQLPHVAVISTLNLLLWFMDGLARS